MLGKKNNYNKIIDYSAKFYLFPLLFFGLLLRSIDQLFLKLKYHK